MNRWRLKYELFLYKKIRVLTRPDLRKVMATSDPAGGWWPRHDTSFLATLCRHKTNKRNPIIEKEANEQHVIALSHIPYQPDYIMKIIVLLSVLPIATAVGPFVPFPYEPFGIYKQRQWVGLCAEISCGLTYRWKCDIVVVEDTRISRLSRSEINVLFASINRYSSHSCHLFIVDITSNRGIEHH